jgi:hypothetical protein
MGPMLYLVFVTSAAIATYRAARVAGLAWQPAGIRAMKTVAWPWNDDAMHLIYTTTATSGIAEYRFRVPEAGWHVVRFGLNESMWGFSDRRAVPARAFVGCVSLMAAPLGFVLLPISRRLARVRWRHLIRIALYSFMIFLIPLGADCYIQMTGEFGRALVIMPWFITIASALAGLLWWSAATRNYLRIPHAWAVGVYVLVFGYVLQNLILQAIDMALEMLR